MMLTPAPFHLNPDLDIAGLADHFARTGRIQIVDFLTEESARLLSQDLNGSNRWRHVVNGETQVFEAEPAVFDGMPADQRAALDQAMFTKAAQGFQFSYDTIRTPDDAPSRMRSGTLLDTFALFMSAPATLNCVARITGNREIVFADAQATRYRTGDFLTRHDDDVAGKGRHFAYVLGLTEGWRPEWGGLLLFNGRHGDIVETMTPRFNALSLFAIGQPHSVSYVAPYAPKARQSVTGWYRSAGTATGAEPTAPIAGA
jgi:Rps23 Pro-64 3,4-dihydroxylase Tpa1-like proline 4-hydroxylase